MLLAVLVPATTVAGEGSPQGAAAAEEEERFDTVDARGQRASDEELARFRGTARQRGTVRVLIGLRVAFTPEGVLSEDARGVQRADIARETAAVRRALAGTGHDVVHTYETVPYVAAEVSERALERLEAAEVFASIHEDALARPQLAESSAIVEANELSAVGRSGLGHAIAVLDTGIQKTHPFLRQADGSAKVVSEACYSANGDCPGGATASTGPGTGINCTYAASGCAHGTHVAGIAAGRGASFSGVARDAKLISIQVYSRFTGTDCNGQAEDPCTLSFASDQLKGLERVYALRNTFSIAAVNMSLGGGSFSSACDADPLKPAIDNLRAARIPTVIPSGDDGFTNAVNAPGCISTAVTVGSTGDGDSVSAFSNSSGQVDLFAPGEDITSSVPGGGFGTKSGTSMAAPHVAGGFAAIRDANPAVSASVAQSAFALTGRPITDTLANPAITRDRIRVLSASSRIRHTGFRPAESFLVQGGGLASNGAGFARRTPADHNPTTSPSPATINLTGIPPAGTVKKAWLVWQTVGGPDPTATLDGVSRTGTLVGASAQFGCWNTNDGGAVRTYRYVIPAGQITGNGTHSVSGIGGVALPTAGRPDGQGASLVVVYEIPSAPKSARAYVRFGSMTVRPGDPAASHTFTGLVVPSAVTGAALHVGMGDGESPNDPAMTFQGTAIGSPNLWSGTDGTYWDDTRIAIPSGLIPAGTTMRSNAQGATGECLTWAFAALTYRYG